MSNLTDEDFNIKDVVAELCKPESYNKVFMRPKYHDIHMPSIEELKRAVEMLRSVIFPGYYIHSELRENTMDYYIGATLAKCYAILAEQFKRGYCFACCSDSVCSICETSSSNAVRGLFKQLPYIRHMLTTDAEAAYAGDPAARSIGETVFSYPSVRALTNHRIAHELYRLGVPIVPRLISEMAHSEAGIDIHPGADIGEHFFIDHGTGTVIGETSIIGQNVRIYQGVTLGAKSFPMDDEGNPIKGVPRHPVVEDNVIIYAGATVLGRVTIGKGAEIGGNVWITRDVPPGERVIQRRAD
jgi:serine O-acetyltransferase